MLHGGGGECGILQLKGIISVVCEAKEGIISVVCEAKEEKEGPNYIRPTLGHDGMRAKDGWARKFGRVGSLD